MRWAAQIEILTKQLNLIYKTSDKTCFLLLIETWFSGENIEYKCHKIILNIGVFEVVMPF